MSRADMGEGPSPAAYGDGMGDDAIIESWLVLGRSEKSVKSPVKNRIRGGRVFFLQLAQNFYSFCSNVFVSFRLPRILFGFERLILQ